MHRHRLPILVLSLWTFAAPAPAQVAPALVRLDGNGPHYLYSVRQLVDGDQVYLQYPKGAKPTCCARLDGNTARRAPSDPDAIDLGTSQPLYRYRFMSRSIRAPLPFIGLAAVGRGARARTAGAWRIELRSGETVTDFTLCVTPQGVQVERQAPRQRPTRLYLHLGYDLEYPPCPGNVPAPGDAAR